MLFVYGSNEQGKNFGGAAKVAQEKHGAQWGKGFGRQGNSFAIPTVSGPTGEPGVEISFDTLKFYIDCFLLYAKTHPELEFQVTRIGCGLAGWKDEDVAPLFIDAPANCKFDSAWTPYLPGKSDWGTF